MGDSIMRKTIAFLALALIATPAAASDWRSVGINASGSKYWIDASSKARTGDTVVIWVKAQYGSAGPNGTTSYKAHREIKCGSKSFRDLETIYFKGELVNSTSGVEDPRTASPDSIAEAVVDAACRL